MMRTGIALILAALFGGAIGCESLNKVGRGMDIASEHITTEKPVYEGTLQSAAKVGALIAVQFVDGKSFEVVDCPAPIVSGDIVRIYQTDKGYVAHLWKSGKPPVIPGVILTPQQPTH